MGGVGSIKGGGGSVASRGGVASTHRQLFVGPLLFSLALESNLQVLARMALRLLLLVHLRQVVLKRARGKVRGGPGGGAEGICRSSLDARKPQNPVNSEEYQGYLQGVLYIV
eukprot:1161172-Prorocentrum_minimum.AAC.1